MLGCVDIGWLFLIIVLLCLFNMCRVFIVACDVVVFLVCVLVGDCLLVRMFVVSFVFIGSWLFCCDLLISCCVLCCFRVGFCFRRLWCLLLLLFIVRISIGFD